MTNGLVGGLVAVGAVVVLALLMRAMQGRGAQGVEPAPPGPSPGPPRDEGGVAVAEPEEDDEDDDADDGEPDEHAWQVVAVTSEGAAFVPDRHAVRLVPPEDEGEAWKVGAGMRSRNVRGEQALAMSWHAADFTGARVVRGEADEGPWRLEALGRDGEYVTFSFETREGAEAARQLFEKQGVVQLGEDEDGRPMPPSPEQFAEARRIYQETAAALDAPDDEDAG